MSETRILYDYNSTKVKFMTFIEGIMNNKRQRAKSLSICHDISALSLINFEYFRDIRTFGVQKSIENPVYLLATTIGNARTESILL